MVLGSTASMICYIMMDASNIAKLPSLQLIRIKLPQAGSILGTSNPYRQVSVPSLGFPLLHMYPCMDFDDARGVALLGNAAGEICLVEFEGGGVNRKEGIDDSLPVLDYMIDKRDWTAISVGAMFS